MNDVTSANSHLASNSTEKGEDVSLPAMTGAELKATREYLGLSVGWVCERLAINERRLGRMESGAAPIPMAIVTLMDDVYEETNVMVDRLTADYRRKVKQLQGESLLVRTYRDGEYEREGGKYPSRWHRVAMARVASGAPGVVLTYEELPSV